MPRLTRTCQYCLKDIIRRYYSLHLRKAHAVTTITPKVTRPAVPSTSSARDNEKDSITTPILKHQVRVAVNHCYDFVLMGIPFHTLDPVIKKVAPKLNTAARHATAVAMEATIRKQRIKMSAMACEWDNRPVESRRRIVAKRDYSKSLSSKSGTTTCSCSSSSTNVEDREKDVSPKTPTRVEDTPILQMTELSGHAVTDDLIMTVQDEDPPLPYSTSLLVSKPSQCSQYGASHSLDTPMQEQTQPSTPAQVALRSKFVVKKKRKVVESSQSIPPKKPRLTLTSDPNNNNTATTSKVDKSAQHLLKSAEQPQLDPSTDIKTTGQRTHTMSRSLRSPAGDSISAGVGSSKSTTETSGRVSGTKSERKVTDRRSQPSPCSPAKSSIQSRHFVGTAESNTSTRVSPPVHNQSERHSRVSWTEGHTPERQRSRAVSSPPRPPRRRSPVYPPTDRFRIPSRWNSPATQATYQRTRLPPFEDRPPVYRRDRSQERQTNEPLRIDQMERQMRQMWHFLDSYRDRGVNRR